MIVLRSSYDALKKEHDELQKKYDKLKKEYDDIMSIIREKTRKRLPPTPPIKDNNE